jgi:cytochrome bd-type quinol oxidase subunit 1
MGVVSGVVLSYQFGTNWSRFSAVLGNVVGPMIGYEVLDAFFLGATILGVMLFGWNRVTFDSDMVGHRIVAIGCSGVRAFAEDIWVGVQGKLAALVDADEMLRGDAA